MQLWTFMTNLREIMYFKLFVSISFLSATESSSECYLTFSPSFSSVYSREIWPRPQAGESPHPSRHATELLQQVHGEGFGRGAGRWPEALGHHCSRSCRYLCVHRRQSGTHAAVRPRDPHLHRLSFHTGEYLPFYIKTLQSLISM